MLTGRESPRFASFLHGIPARVIMCRRPGLLVVAAVGMVLFTWWLRCRYSTLRVTDKRSILDTGYLSRATNELRHVDVRNIEVNQTFWQRLFGTGSIEISTAARDEGEIAIAGILEPHKVAALIRERQEGDA